jgi:hypothetical protein
LIDSAGNRLEDPAPTKREVVSFYQQLLGHSNAVNESNMIHRVPTLMTDQISDEAKAFLQQEVNEAETRSTMLSLGSEKAPVLDGFTAYFFKKAWPIVGRDVCQSVKSFFQTGSLLKEVNSTIITLIPKAQNPSRVAEVRPNACSNVLYKCMIKFMVNRLRSCLSDL